MKVVFGGTALEVAPAEAPERRIFAEGHNTPHTIALVLGAMDRSAELVLLNPRLTAPERSAQVQSISGIPPAGEPALILFTSGTTGFPKAARLARDNLEASALAANQVLEVDARSRFLCVLPLFHVGGLGILFRCRRAGATVLLHERFDAAAVARELREGATHASLVANTLVKMSYIGLIGFCLLQRFPAFLILFPGIGDTCQLSLQRPGLVFELHDSHQRFLHLFRIAG